MEGKIVEYQFEHQSYEGAPKSVLRRPALILAHDKKSNHVTLAIFSFDDGLVFDPSPITEHYVCPVRLVRLNDVPRGMGNGQWHEFGARW